MKNRDDKHFLNLKEIGSYFENQVDYYLKTLFPNYYVLHDIEIYSDYLGEFTQIDNLLITPHCIYVIEAKNWSKYIQGNYNDLYWLGQGNGKNTIKVVNVYDQNLLHVRCLRNYLITRGIFGIPIRNYIVLPDNTNLYTDCEEVCNFSKLGLLIVGDENSNKELKFGYKNIYEQILNLDRRKE